MNIEEHLPLGLEPPASNKSGWFVFAGYDKDGNDFYLHGDGIIRNGTGHNGRSLGYFPSSEDAEVARQAWLRENNPDIKQAAEENARLRAALVAKECQKCRVDGYWFFATKIGEERQDVLKKIVADLVLGADDHWQTTAEGAAVMERAKDVLAD